MAGSVARAAERAQTLGERAHLAAPAEVAL
jgi:hypothetical protein